MVRELFSKIARTVSSVLHQPALVFSACLVLVTFGLVLDGSLFRLWALHRDSKDIAAKIEESKINTGKLQAKIKQAQDPMYIEMQARERLDLVGEHDLVFVFSDEE